jgi:ferric-dicitrate binding protein FerR (iron transport regulator)
VTDRPDWQTIDRYLAGEASPEEEAAVVAWTARAPANAAALEALHARFAARDDAAWDVEAAWGRVRGRMAAGDEGARVLPLDRARGGGGGAARGRRRVAWRVAAALVVAAAGLGTWRAATRGGPGGGAAVADVTELVAPPGRHLSAPLPDGSRVTLHAGSRLRYAAGLGARGRPRDVTLDGEAYFEVTHDAARPFRVRARHAVAEDLGTRFVVRAYAEAPSVEVVVAEGVVALRRAPARGAPDDAPGAVLRRGQLGRLAAAGAPTVEPAEDVDRLTGWTAGTLALDGTLADALPRLERWYDVDVVLADPRLASRRVTARFRDEPLPQALDALAIALGATYTRSGRTVTFGGAR